MVCLGEGVWLTMRLDSTLRLYHASTYQHLQDIDIEPYVSKMLGTGKLGFSFVRITSLMAACNRLWIGTGNGVIICVPLSENTKPSSVAHSCATGGVYHAYSDHLQQNETILTATSVGSAGGIAGGAGSQLPYCFMAQAQLSFHGHRDAVKFFVAVPDVATTEQTESSELRTNLETKQKMLIMSGGEGYVDFRVGANNTADIDEDHDNGLENVSRRGEPIMTRTDYSHLIVWQVYS
jgi:hypothetical protein